jgi:hypothetical protein
MEEISYCGLICRGCPIFLIALESNKEKKDKMIGDIISACRENYGINYKYEDINECSGCKASNGRIFSGCKNCSIRKCAVEREFENCAYCGEYPCKQLLEIFQNDFSAKMRLDSIRLKIH